MQTKMYKNGCLTCQNGNSDKRWSHTIQLYGSIDANAIVTATFKALVPNQGKVLQSI